MSKRYPWYAVSLCAFLGVAGAQSVDLKGEVHDRYSSRPLVQAKVSLARLGHQAITDPAGRFHILHVPLPVHAESVPPKLGVLSGRRLAWHAPGPGTVALQLLDPSGDIRWMARHALPAGGDWELGIGALPPGVYVAVLQGPGFRHAAKVVLMGKGEAAEASATAAPTKRRPANALAKSAAVVDTLLVSCEGYQPFSLPIASLDQSGLALGVSDTAASRATLARMGISGGNLEPAFSSNIPAYRVAVRQGVLSLGLTLETAAGKPSIRVNGVVAASGTSAWDLPLSLGRNAIQIALTSQDSSTHSNYALDVHRAYDDSAALSHLRASAGTLVPAFHPQVFAYSLQVPMPVAQVALTAEAFQPLCSLSLDGRVLSSGTPSPALPLGPDSTAFTVMVASPDRARQIPYRIQVQRTVAGDDASLKSITLTPFHPGMKPFHRDTLEYVMHVEPWDSVYSITAIPSHSSATLEIRDTAQASGVARRIVLPPEWNNWWIDVTSADGTKTRKYNVTFYRQKMHRTPILSGPNVVTSGVRARFSNSALGAPPCGEFDIRYRMATGTGDTVITRHADSIPYTWTAPGIYAARLQSMCFDKNRPEIIDGQSLWSAPKYVTVETGEASSRVRRISGVRTSPETWSPDTTYIIQSHSRFDTAALLTILPGTWVMFSGPDTYLEVTALSAVGTAQDSIHFVGGVVRLLWSGGPSYQADGRYRAGPRCEYCSLKDVRLTVMGNTAAKGGYGPYLRNSYVKLLTGDTSKLAAGTYAERCRIEGVDGMRLFESRIVNSHLGTTRIVTEPGRATEIRRCDIQTLSILASDFREADIAGNTIRRFSANHAFTTLPGKLSGNNLHSAAAVIVTIGGSPVDMRGNWWGEAVTAEMAAKGIDQNISVIQDGFDDAARAKADYGGWLTAPVPDAAPDW